MMSQLFDSLQPQTVADSLGGLNYPGSGLGGATASSVNIGSLIGANNSASSAV